MHLTSAKMNTRLGWIKIMSQNLCASGDTHTFADIDTVRIDRINTYSTINIARPLIFTPAIFKHLALC